MATIAGVQVALALLLAGTSLSHLGAPMGSFIGHSNLATVLPAAGRTSSLYICASLPLFLGGELRGGSLALRRGIGLAFAAVAALAIIGVFPLAGAKLGVLESDVTGVALAQAFSGRWLAVVIGLGVAISVAGLIIAEFLALSRLMAALFKRSSLQMVRVVAGCFLVASSITLVNPTGAYGLLLKPSLIALWISQLLVVAVYPWFVRRHRQLLAGDVGLAAAGSAVMLFGLFTAVTSTSTT